MARGQGKNKECKGCLVTGVKCTKSRRPPGYRIQMSKPCSKCKEWRCRGHCRCARRGHVSGRQASRGHGVGGGASAPAMQLPKLRLPTLPAPAAARGPTGKIDKVDVLEGFGGAIGELDAAKTVIIASYTYDADKLHLKLMKGLRAEKLMVEVLVDGEQARRGKSRTMMAKLKELSGAGAVVRLCKGRRHGGYHGSYHHKALIMDGQADGHVAYVGSANFTEASHTNAETVLRLTGPSTHAVLANILKGRSGSCRMDAS